MELEVGAYAPTGWHAELEPWAERPDEAWRVVHDWARRAEALDYDLLVVGDHLTDVPAAAGAAVFEAWTALSALAPVTERIRLGQMALGNTYRHPALLAKMAATLDAVSGGRLELCLGAAWFRPDHDQFGFPFPEPPVRIEALAEAARIVRALWSGEAVTITGRHYSLVGAHGAPRPLQRPAPRLWIAGSGPRRTLRVTAESADVANFGGPPEEYAQHATRLAEHCEAIGRDPAEIALSWSGDCVLRESEAEIRTLFDQGAVRDVRRRSYAAWAPRYLVGTPDQVVARVDALVEAGCSILVPWFSDAPDPTSLRLFAEEVRPRLAVSS